MDQTVTDAVEAIMARETWSAEDHRELMKELLAMSDAPRKFKGIVAKLEAQTPELKGAAALKVGIARYTLCRFAEALKALSVATDNKDRRYFQAQCLKNLHRYDEAAEELRRAADRGWDAARIQLELIEVAALSGKLDAAEKALSTLAGKIGETADYLYLRGLTDELSGNGERAAEAYVKARSIDPNHVAATFRLAYYCDLHGEEDQAVELYTRCIMQPPVHANALLNLAVLHEDAGRYDKAVACLKTILATNPNNARARLFLKDAQASKTMYYDEDQAKRIARRNAVLDIPVTDFELSVRARNCLKKMNIRTLGDLVNATESDLLSYKNFGETSLKEIKDMLAAKNLRLGQALEEEDEYALDLDTGLGETVRDEGVLVTPIAQIELSVRARRALESLGVATLGELAGKTEAELMGCRNFGQTTLNEVRQRLAEYGLQLRESS